jgi:glycosyltransferase involved in cell wall biosynthesis
MISVCIATYNGEKYIKEQLDSVLCQLGKNDEVVISDDGSTDNTLSIIQKLNDPRIKVYPHQQEQNNYSGTLRTCFMVGRNAAHALKQASGDIIFLADQDDVWLENKVAACVHHLEKYDLVLSDCIITDENLTMLYPSHFEVFGYPKINVCQNLYKTKFLGCCLAFNRALLNRVLPFPAEPIMHDVWIGLLACRYGKIKIEKTPYVLYRRHTGNASISVEEKKTSLGFKLIYRSLLLAAFIKHVCQNRNK